MGRVAAAGGQVRHLLDLEAKAVGVEKGRLLGVADVEPDVVHIDELERIGG